MERRQGTFDFNGQPALLVDLPGTYSLTANSPEEVIAREFILRESPAVVVAVCQRSQPGTFHVPGGGIWRHWNAPWLWH